MYIYRDKNGKTAKYKTNPIRKWDINRTVLSYNFKNWTTCAVLKLHKTAILRVKTTKLQKNCSYHSNCKISLNYKNQTAKLLKLRKTAKIEPLKFLTLSWLIKIIPVCSSKSSISSSTGDCSPSPLYVTLFDAVGLFRTSSSS